MAPPKGRRVQIESNNEQEDDSPRRNVRRRLSESNVADTSDRVPLNPVNINDDAQERRRRRKSTKAPAIDATADDEQDDPDSTANAADSSRSARQQRPLNAIQPPVIEVPRDVMHSNFEEWIKMATDNVRAFHFFFSEYNV